jgi:hypothetical protein
MTSKSPLVDDRDFDNVLFQLRELAKSYLNNQWIYGTNINDTHKDIISNKDDPGIALSKSFALMYMNIIKRLNKLPERNFIEFLNMLGFDLSAPVASKVPVTFKIVDGAKDDVFVPSGTKVGTDSNDKHDELIFETDENMLVTRTNIAEIYTINKAFDNIHSYIEKLNEKQDFKLFSNNDNGEEEENVQQHIFYLGHADIFNLKDIAVKIKLTLHIKEGNLDDLIKFLTDNKKVVWEYNWKYDKNGKEIKDFADLHTLVANKDVDKKGTIILNSENKIKIEKSKVNDIESYWIRCRVIQSKNIKNVLKDIDNLPKIDKIKVNVELDSDNKSTIDNDTNPDMLFYKDVPLKISTDNQNKEDNPIDKENKEPIYPFGKQPFTYDIFYIASNNCFSKKNAIITLQFINLNPNFKGDATENQEIKKPIISWEYWNGKCWNALDIINTKSKEDKEDKITSFEFECPADIEKNSVNGNENYWIRIRIVSGDYGKVKLKQTLKPALTFGEDNNKNKVDIDIGKYDWDYDDIKPPKFEKIKIKFAYASQSKDSQKMMTSSLNDKHQKISIKEKASEPFCISFNNLQYYIHISPDIEKINPFKPFKIFQDDNDDGKNLKNSIQINNNNNNEDKNRKFIITSVLKETTLTTSPTAAPAVVAAYIGFDSKINGGPTLIYFSITEQRNNDYDITDKKLNFYYYSTNGWSRLYAEDTTNYFTKKGWIKFYVPLDFKTRLLFGKDLFWVKVEDSANIYNGKNKNFPQVKGVFINTVSCINAFTIEDEILVKDTKTLNELNYFFSKRPLTSIYNKKEEIWVKEKSITDNIEREYLLKNSRLRERRDDVSQNVIETWVLWKESGIKENILNNITGKSSSSLPSFQSDYRVYSIDRTTGKLTLGAQFYNIIDKENINIGGQEATALSFTDKDIIDSDGIVKANYIVGGSSNGNVNEGEITTLKSFIPFIDFVTNYENAEGGSDAQTTQNALETMPTLIKNRGQAVTAEDFESIITSNFNSVSKSKCFTATDNKGEPKGGHILIIIIPKAESLDNNQDSKNNDNKYQSIVGTGTSALSLDDQKRPTPSFGLIANIKQFLSKISEDNIILPNRLNIAGPDYFKVSITATIYSITIDNMPIVEKKSLELLKIFLNPVNGGKEGKGWEFKKISTISDIYWLLSSIKEIDHIDHISLKVQYSDGKNEMIVNDNDNNDNNNIESKLKVHSLLSEGDEHNLQIKLMVEDDKR